MTDEERDRMKQLCAKIVSEKDPATFNQLVKELCNLLEGESKGLAPN